MLNNSFYIEVFIAAGIYLATFIYLGVSFLRNMPLKDWLLRLSITPALVLHLIILANREFFLASNSIKTLNILSLLAMLVLFVNFASTSKNNISYLAKFAHILLPVSSLGLFILGVHSAKKFILELNFSFIVYLIILTLALSLLILAIIQSLILAWQYKILKNKKATGALDFFPPLQSIQTIMFDLLTIAWILLSFSVLNTFSLALNKYLKDYYIWIFSGVFTLWFYFGIILLLRFTGRIATLRGVKLVYLGSFIIFGVYLTIYLFLAYF